MSEDPPKCPRCRAELGPWEDPAGCVTCTGRTWFANDRLVRVLERSDGPLYRWDVDRALRHRAPRSATGQALADDLRFCWAGRSLYGLYRHGLLPGARDLGTVAGAFIHASDTRLSLEKLHFILRFVGYRYTFPSLRAAVVRVEDRGMFRNPYWWDASWEGRATSKADQREVARALGFPRRGPAFYAAMARASEQTRRGLAERARRLLPRTTQALRRPEDCEECGGKGVLLALMPTVGGLKLPDRKIACPACAPLRKLQGKEVSV